MKNQENITIIDNREKKDIIHFLKAYKATIDKVYNETKKHKPFQSALLSALASESVDVNKLILNLERK